MERLRTVLAAVGLLVLFGAAIAHAEHGEDLDNAAAVDGLSTIKVVVDLNVGEPKLLLFRLKMIDYTRRNIIDEGKKPDFIVAVRGGASRYMTEADRYVTEENRAIKAEIASRVRELISQGVRFEQCAVAAEGQGIDPEYLLDGVMLVRNGYVSLVAYQNKGHALLPMD